MNFTTVSLPALLVGMAQNVQLSVSGATSSVAFQVSAGALPSGLALSMNGALTGSPLTAGPYDFTVTATDAVSRSAVQTFSGVVVETPNNRVDDLLTVVAAAINALSGDSAANAAANARAADTLASVQSEVAQLQASTLGNGNLVDEDFAKNFVAKLTPGPAASAAAAALALTLSANG